MIVLGHLLRALGMLVSSLLGFFVFVVIARVVVSWVNADPYNPIVRFIHEATEPFLAPLRRKMPQLGALDLSPMILILVLYFLQNFLAALMVDYGTRLLAGG